MEVEYITGWHRCSEGILIITISFSFTTTTTPTTPTTLFTPLHLPSTQL